MINPINYIRKAVRKAVIAGIGDAFSDLGLASPKPDTQTIQLLENLQDDDQPSQLPLPTAASTTKRKGAANG